MSKPRIPIVDAKDEIIGYRYRDEIQPEDIYRVAGVWIMNEKGEVLLAKRALAKAHDPGKWGTSAAGTLEEGETYDSNIRKEMEEELGLTVEVIKGEKVFLEGEHRFFCQWFHVVVSGDQEFKLQEEEVDEVRWFSRSTLEKELESNPNKYLSRIRRYIEEIPGFK
jgi:isopentenyldiphosphate isomerase